MKLLRLPPLERKIKKRIKAEIRTSEELMAEAKRLKPSLSSSNIPAELSFIIIMLFIVSIILSITKPCCHLFVFSILTSLITFFLCGSLLSNLKRCNDLFVLSHYPLRDPLYFMIEWRKCVRSSLFILFMSFIFFSGYELVHKSNQSFLMGWIALFSFLAWLVSLMMIIILTFFFKKMNFSLLGFIGILVLISFVLILRFSNLDPSLDSQWMILTTPAGIISSLFLHGVHGGAMSVKLLSLAWLLSVPVIFIFYSKYRSSYRSEDIYESCFPFANNEHIEYDSSEAREPYAGEDSISVKFPPPLPAKRIGWVERTAMRFLSREELEKAPYIYDYFGTSWSTCWKYGVILMFILFGAMTIFQNLEAVFAIGILLSFAIGTPLLGGTWKCFSSFYWHPGFYQFNIMFPVSYWKTCRFILKLNFIRLVLWIPASLLSGAFIDWHFEGNGVRGIVLSSLLLLLITVLQPIMVSLKFGFLSSDKEITFSEVKKSFILVCMFLLEGFLVISPLVASALFVGKGKYLLILAGILVAGIFSFLFWFLNGILYERTKVDIGVFKSNPDPG